MKPLQKLNLNKKIEKIHTNLKKYINKKSAILPKAWYILSAHKMLKIN